MRSPSRPHCIRALAGSLIALVRPRRLHRSASHEPAVRPARASCAPGDGAGGDDLEKIARVREKKMSLSYTTDAVIFEVAGGIATITLNRPQEGNAITRELSLGMGAVWDEVKRNADIRVAIITGAGERYFCTGAAAGEIKTGDEGVGLQNGTLNEI